MNLYLSALPGKSNAEVGLAGGAIATVAGIGAGGGGHTAAGGAGGGPHTTRFILSAMVFLRWSCSAFLTTCGAALGVARTWDPRKYQL